MFFWDVMKFAGLDGFSSVAGYNIIDFNGESLYVDGIKKILLLSQQKITLQFKRCVVNIEGELQVERLEEDSIIIKGRIDSLCKESISVRKKDFEGDKYEKKGK